MKFSNIVAPVSLIGMASAVPSLSRRGGGPGDDKCIPYNTAVGIVQAFVSTLTAFDVNTATNLLAPGFTDTSSSINFLTGAPLEGLTFPSPGAYIAGQGAQPAIGVDILNIDAVTCDGVIAFRWVGHVGLDIAPSNGISILYTIKSGPDPTIVGPGGYQLETLFSEFNSAAWVEDIGGSVTLPPPQSS